MNKSKLEIEKAVKLLADAANAISSVEGDFVISKDPTDIKSLLIELEPAVIDIQKGRPIKDVFGERGIGFDPTVATFGFGCTDNCNCGKDRALTDLGYLRNRLTEINKIIAG